MKIGNTRKQDGKEWRRLGYAAWNGNLFEVISYSNGNKGKAFPVLEWEMRERK